MVILMGEDKEIIEGLKERIRHSFSLEKLLCYFSLELPHHLSKKNGRPIFKNRRTGISFTGKSQRLRITEKAMIEQFILQRKKQGIIEPLSCRLWTIMHFHFKREDFFTKKGEISLKLPDLSNLLQLPEDCLQKAGVISNDTLIDSHDLSRRLIGPTNKLEVFILKYE